jgi:hypothetical protein
LSTPEVILNFFSKQFFSLGQLSHCCLFIASPKKPSEPYTNSVNVPYYLHNSIHDLHAGHAAVQLLVGIHSLDDEGKHLLFHLSNWWQWCQWVSSQFAEVSPGYLAPEDWLPAQHLFFALVTISVYSVAQTSGLYLEPLNHPAEGKLCVEDVPPRRAWPSYGHWQTAHWQSALQVC